MTVTAALSGYTFMTVTVALSGRTFMTVTVALSGWTCLQTAMNERQETGLGNIGGNFLSQFAILCNLQ